MKKILAFLIVLAMVTTVFMIPVNAAQRPYMFGDVTKDDKIDILDATEIQRCLARIVDFNNMERVLADFNNDDSLTVLDATSVQMFCSKLIDNPHGDHDYLESFIDIKDIEITSLYGPELLEGKAVEFEVILDDVYDGADATPLKYKYTFTGITDPTFIETYEKSNTGSNRVGWSFEKAGVYEINVEIRHRYLETYSYSEQFEIKPRFLFDQKLFVSYDQDSNYHWDYPAAPEGSTPMNYELVVDKSVMSYTDECGHCSYSERFVALVSSKAEYDKLFEIDNALFDDEFFETKSLIVAVSPGYDHYDYSSITNIVQKDGVIYVSVEYGNSYPDPTVAHPTCPDWYSFASVDKADVANVTLIQRVQ